MGAGTPVERRHSRLSPRPGQQRAAVGRPRLQRQFRLAPHRSTRPTHYTARVATAWPPARSRRPTGGTCRRRTALGSLQELGRQQVGRRNRHTARRAHGTGLSTGQAQPAAARHPAQRLRDRGDHAEIRARADHDDRAAARNLRTAAPSRRADGPMPFGFVMSLAPIMMTAASGGGPATNMASIWPGQPLRRGAHNRLGAQADPLTGLLGQPARDQHAGHLVGVRAAVPGGGRVAEDHQV